MLHMVCYYIAHIILFSLSVLWNERWRLKQQNSAWNLTPRNHSSDCLCLHTTYMPHDHAFLKYKMEFYYGNLLWLNYNWYIFHLYPLSILNIPMTVRADISHSFIYHNVARPNHVAGCKALPKDPHSITLIYRGAVWPFRSLFLPSVSPSSHCPPQLPSGNVPNPCSPISISKVRYHHGSYWREIFVIIMTRIILVLFDKFDWGLIELFL